MKITIPVPCTENWDNMLQKEQGKFCLKCSKIVIDFSSQSKEEILQFFQNSKGKICGRFSNNQLEKIITPSIITSYFSKRISKFGFVLLLTFGSSLFYSCSSKNKDVQKIEDKKVQVKNKKMEEVNKPKIENCYLGEASNKDCKIQESKKALKMKDTIKEISIETEKEFPQEKLMGAPIIEY